MKRSAFELITPFRITRWLFLSALLFWLVTPVAWMLAAPDWLAGRWGSPTVLFLVHLYALGWLTTTALAALHQLIAVILEVPVFSPQLAAWGMALYLPGVALFLFGFALRAYAGVAAGGALLLCGLAVMVYNFARTLARGRQGRRFWPVGLYIASALSALGLVALVGIAMAGGLAGILSFDIARSLPLHMWLAGGGWFGLLVIGVTYHLSPLFGLSGKLDRRLAAVVYVLVASGVLAGVAAHLTGLWALERLGVLLLVLGILAHLGDVARHAWIDSGKRPEAVLPFVRAGQAYLLYCALQLGWLFLAPGAAGVQAPAAPAAGGAGPLAHAATQVERLAAAALAGWLSQSVVGYLHRILPFLAWHERFSSHQGGPPPSLRGMVDQRLAWSAWVLYNLGLLLVLDVPIGSEKPLELVAGVLLLGVGTALAVTNLALVFWRVPDPVEIPVP